MTRDWWIPSDAPCLKPSQHGPGTLLALVSRSAKPLPICWALRFDDLQGVEKIPCLYLLDGSPLGSSDQNTVIACKDAHIDDLAAAGIGAPNYTVRIDFSPGNWILDNEMNWYDAKGHVVIGEFGMRLCGYDRYRPQHSHVWIDCATWEADPNVGQQVATRTRLVTAYAPTWRVVARRSPQETITVPFGLTEKLVPAP